MKNRIKSWCGIWVLFLLGSTAVHAQTVLTGKVTDPEGNGLPGANVYVKDSYDGATTDTAGVFSFSTIEAGDRILVVSFIGFEPSETAVLLEGKEITVNVQLKEAYSEQNTVVISAGGFGANDRSKAVILNPIDIVTTAGAQGDIFQSLQYLPGTQAVGEENGIFVRGGSAAETVTIIDEMVVQRPFFSSVPDVPARSRFNPFLFKGTFFSTGGYSARYGQAMSSALILNSQDLPDTTNGGFNLTMASVGGFYTHKKKNTSVTVDGNYSDTRPLFLVNKQQVDWEMAPRAGNASVIFRHKPNKDGILKVYGTASLNRFILNAPSEFDPSVINRTDLLSHNVYTNASYRTLLNENWAMFAGASYSNDGDDLDVDSLAIGRGDSRSQAKLWFSRAIFKNSKLWFGGESHMIQSGQRFDIYEQELQDLYSAGFAEAEIYLSPKVALRVGGRAEYSTLLQQANIAPRTSFAVQTGKASSVSLAYGTFLQNPSNEFLYWDTSLRYEKATHYLANYTWTRDKRIFRVEGYYKAYDQLVRTFADSTAPSGLTYDNSGDGYAYGLDVFFRDQKTIRNGDYWVSYSYLNTERLFRDYPIAATPTFASTHNVSLVYKHFFSSLRTSFGASYAFATGRPYFNPNSPYPEGFHSDLTPNYHLVSANAAYLTTIKDNFTVVFLSVGNVLGRNNVFGYRFSPDGQSSRAVNPTQRRSFFIGMFISFR